jgi:hypothetical protein
VTTFQQQVAAYIRALERGLRETRRAEDRPLYEKYLAGAAGLLAAVALDDPVQEIQARVEEHTRLWGYTWVQDPAYKPAAAMWEQIRGHFQSGAT